MGFFDFPAQISISVRKLISGLLEQDLSKRLGCMVNAAEEVKQHIWFRGVDWAMVTQKKIQPPWVPELSNGTDFKYFDEYPDSGTPIEEPTS